MTSLFIKVAKLAKEEPGLRPFLMPLLREAAEKPTYRDYVEKKKKKNEKPMDEDAWKAKVLGEGKKEAPKAELPPKAKAKVEALKNKRVKASKVKIRVLMDSIEDEEASMKSIKDQLVAEKTKTLKAKGVILMGGVQARQGQNGLLQTSWTQSAYGYGTGGKDVMDTLPKEDKRNKSYAEAKKNKKEWEAQLVSAKKKLTELQDEDYSGVEKELAAFGASKPRRGEKLSDAELLKKFLSKAAPETKERMKGVTPAEFKEIMAAIMDEEE
jgi:hypothetical protein